MTSVDHAPSYAQTCLRVFLSRGAIRGLLLVILCASLARAAQGSCFARGVEAAPQAEPAKTNQALADTEQGDEQLGKKDLAAAEAWFRKAIAADPNLAEAHHGLGLALWDQGRADEALRELTEAARLSPHAPAPHLDLARAAWTLAARSRPPSGSGGAGAEIISDSYRQVAIEEFTKVLSLDPKDVPSRLSLAELYLEASKPKQAISEAQHAAEFDPPNAEAFVLLGRADLALGNEDQAAAEFEKAIQLKPGDGESYFALGQLRAGQRNYPEAVKAFRNAIRASPRLEAAYSDLAQVLEATHQSAEARSVLEQAIALDPNDWQSVYQLGRILAASGREDDAMALFQRALRLHADFPQAREQLALGLVRRHDLSGAQTQAETIIAQHPKSAEGHRVMALVLWKQRNYDASLAECAQALEANPESAAVLSVQALDLWQEGQRNAARQAFLAASKLQPNIGSAEIFCRLVACDAPDAGIVGDFLRKNAWVLAPAGGEQ